MTFFVLRRGLHRLVKAGKSCQAMGVTTESLILLAAGLVVIAAAALLGPRLGIASPLVLVAVGVGVSFLPSLAGVAIEPDWILEGLLPPLLYSSAVSMPAMNFRREFGAISGLSILLVVGSSVVLGLFFSWVIPGLSLAWGVALGAIVSPTDAVATSIIKHVSSSQRVVALLDGESLLNDATALVVLRTAIGATAVSFSFGDAFKTFAYSIVVAIVAGWIVGVLNLVVRKNISDSAVNTVLSFAVPFVASIPATMLGASGLVAAVVAGLITGIRAPRLLSPQSRLSDAQNWRTVELLLEGAVFLMMGLQLTTVVRKVEGDHEGIAAALLIAAGAFVVTVVVRAAYVAPLLGMLARRARRNERIQSRAQDIQEMMSTPEGKQQTIERINAHGRRITEQQLERFARRLTQSLASIEYFRREPLGLREGTIVVWAGMRGAVTVAAAETLPSTTPQHSMIVFIAYSVAALSLLVQGGTIGPLVRLISPPGNRNEIAEAAATDRRKIIEVLKTTAESIPQPHHDEGDRSPEAFNASRQHRLTILKAQRSALLDARDNGTFDANILEDALANLDASQIELEMRSSFSNQ